MKVCTLIIVCFNSEEYIQKSIQSLLNQDINHEDIEIILVDGCSDDNTVSIAKNILNKSNVVFKIFSNPAKILATGWNIGIRNSQSKYVCRIDAHSEIPNNYLNKCIEILEISSPNVVGVGGYLINRSTTSFGEIVTDFYSCPFGVGNSPFRIKSKGVKQTDTAVFAVYHASLFDEVGFFDERLGRNQDLEFHERVHARGLTLFTCYDLPITYYVRSTIKAFIKKAFVDGYWIVKSRASSMRHLIPLVFFIYILLSFFLRVFLLDNNIIIYPIYLYLLMGLCFSMKFSTIKLNFIKLLFLFPIYHLSYGYGSFFALLNKHKIT